jgi:hypothetical protein
MTDLIYNHITARIPGTKDHLLINLYGLLCKEITVSSVVKIERARAHRASLSTGHVTTLWRTGMAGDAAPAGGRVEEFGLPAILALSRCVGQPRHPVGGSR